MSSNDSRKPVHTAKVHDVIKDDSLLKVDGEKATAVLVDRVWPRGIAKDDLPYDEWFKDVAPTPDLRKWWNHREEDFDEFSQRYRDELNDNESDELEQLQKLAENGPVVLLFAAKDREVNHAVVLAEWLNENI